MTQKTRIILQRGKKKELKITARIMVMKDAWILTGHVKRMVAIKYLLFVMMIIMMRALTGMMNAGNSMSRSNMILMMS